MKKNIKIFEKIYFLFYLKRRRSLDDGPVDIYAVIFPFEQLSQPGQI